MTARTFFVLLSISCLLISATGCEKDSISEPMGYFPNEYKDGARLLRVWQSSDDGLTRIQTDESYEYDKEGRLIKKSKMGDEKVPTVSYEMYTYNNEGQLDGIGYHYYNLDGTYWNLKNVRLEYDENGLKEREITFFTAMNSQKEVVYEYDGRRLSNKEEYDEQGLLFSRTTYEYDKAGLLAKESLYYSPFDRPSEYTRYTYKDGLNTRADIYKSLNNDYIELRKITKTYDANRNLRHLASKELWFASSMASYAFIYEYEE